MKALTFTATVFALSLTGGMALADTDGAAAYEITGDAAAGEKVFRKCQACHMIGPGAENKVGPVLNGVVGRPMGTAADFEYSDGMMALNAENGVWTPAELTTFLTKPKDYVDGTRMAFAGLRKATDLENVIAYLASFNAEGGAAE